MLLSSSIRKFLAVYSLCFVLYGRAYSYYVVLLVYGVVSGVYLSSVYFIEYRVSLYPYYLLAPFLSMIAMLFMGAGLLSHPLSKSRGGLMDYLFSSNIRWYHIIVGSYFALVLVSLPLVVVTVGLLFVVSSTGGIVWVLELSSLIGFVFIILLNASLIIFSSMVVRRISASFAFALFLWFLLYTPLFLTFLLPESLLRYAYVGSIAYHYPPFLFGEQTLLNVVYFVVVPLGILFMAYYVAQLRRGFVGIGLLFVKVVSVWVIVVSSLLLPYWFVVQFDMTGRGLFRLSEPTREILDIAGTGGDVGVILLHTTPLPASIQENYTYAEQLLDRYVSYADRSGLRGSVRVSNISISGRELLPLIPGAYELEPIYTPSKGASGGGASGGGENYFGAIVSYGGENVVIPNLMGKSLMERRISGVIKQLLGSKIAMPTVGVVYMGGDGDAYAGDGDAYAGDDHEHGSEEQDALAIIWKTHLGSDFRIEWLSGTDISNSTGSNPLFSASTTSGTSADRNLAYDILVVVVDEGTAPTAVVNSVATYLELGGTVLLALDNVQLDGLGLSSINRNQIPLQRVQTGFEPLLASMGIVLSQGLVYDSSSLFVQIGDMFGGVRSVKLPFVLNVQPTTTTGTALETEGVSRVVLAYASAITASYPFGSTGVYEPYGRHGGGVVNITVTPILSSTKQSGVDMSRELAIPLGKQYTNYTGSSALAVKVVSAGESGESGESGDATGFGGLYLVSDAQLWGEQFFHSADNAQLLVSILNSGAVLSRSKFVSGGASGGVSGGASGGVYISPVPPKGRGVTPVRPDVYGSEGVYRLWFVVAPLLVVGFFMVMGLRRRFRAVSLLLRGAQGGRDD